MLTPLKSPLSYRNDIVFTTEDTRLNKISGWHANGAIAQRLVGAALFAVRHDVEAGGECVANCPHIEVGRNMHPEGFCIGFNFGDRLGRLRCVDQPLAELAYLASPKSFYASFRSCRFA
jgi:hypothetical protein